MAKLVDGMRIVLSELDSNQLALVVSAFNNSQSLYRARNRRPRTELMTGGLIISPFQRHGLVTQVALNVCGNRPQDLSTNRYIDIGILSPDSWYSGQRCTQLAIEVENFWHELRGTIRDLLNFQANEKWAVFYHRNLDEASLELHDAATEIWASFESQHLQENPDTPYDILVLPDKIPTAGLLGQEILVAKFLSKEGKAIPSPSRVIL